MPATFLLNGQPLVAPGNPGLGSPLLRRANQAADTLTVVHRGQEVRFDAAPLFAFDQRLVLTRDPGDGAAPVVEFVGTVQEVPRRLGLEETVTYVAHGPWQWLSTYAYMQTFALASNPDAATPTLVATYMGRVVMGQAPDGSRQNLASALADIFAFAIGSGCPIRLGTITGCDCDVPFDQMSDLTCDQAVSRLLQSWAPDAVVVWDYTTTDDAGQPAPTVHVRRRADLAGDEAACLTLHVAPAGGAGIDTAYVPFESIDLAPLCKDQASAVVLFYPKVNQVGSDSWASLDIDKFPLTATGREPRAVVRTIELAGVTASVLTQRCRVLPLATALGGPAPDATHVTPASDPDAFAALAAFWKRKVPALAQPDVVIKGFKDRRRLAATVANDQGGSVTPELDTSLTNELIEGAVTPWMENSTLNRQAQEQNYQVRIAYSVKGVDQKDADGVGIIYSAGVMATNCASKTYTLEQPGNAGDATPVGLAQTLHAALSVLHWSGTFVIVEREASLAWGPGQVHNLGNSLAEWAGMNALVQAATYDLDAARTTIELGPPGQLGADSLAAIYRVNRTRRLVTAAAGRATGIA